MPRVIPLVALCALAVLLSACVRGRYVRRVAYVAPAHGATGWSLEDARNATKIETAVESSGRHIEIEYHTAPDAVPQAVRDAMEAKHPGGTYIGAEKESSGGSTYYELAKEIGGFEVEAMFRPDGTLHEEEIQIPVSDVPQAVQDAIQAAWPGRQVTAWEMIRNGSGTITAYHVKLKDGDKAVKAIVSTGGTVNRAYYEIPAEIEVPIPVPR